MGTAEDELDLPRKDKKQRQCLRCDNLFDSTGPHHRICWRCRKINETQPVHRHGRQYADDYLYENDD